MMGEERKVWRTATHGGKEATVKNQLSEAKLYSLLRLMLDAHQLVPVGGGKREPSLGAEPPGWELERGNWSVVFSIFLQE